MVKVLVIDDDALMLKYLRGLIDWKALGFTSLLESYSSVKALELFKREKPDIVVTDIGMPQMNGLELAEKFKQIKPDVRIVFLTCYEEFDYVKTALKLNADEYLIKDKLEESQLEETLEKSIASVKRLAKIEAQASYEEDFIRNLDVLKASFFDQLVRGGSDESSIVNYARRLGIRWNYPAYRMSVGRIPYSSLLPRYALEDIELLQYSIYNIASEIALGYEGITVFKHKNSIVPILNYRSGVASTPQGRLSSFLLQVQRQVEELLRISLHFISPASELTLGDMPGLYKKLQQDRHGTFYPSLPIAEWRPERGTPVYHPAASSFDLYKKKLESAVLEEEKSAVTELLLAMRADASEKRIQPKDYIGACLEIVRALEVRAGIKARDDMFHYALESALHADDLLKLMSWKLLALLESGRKPAAGSAQPEPKLQLIDRYIAEHLDENISSVDIANYLVLNASYFSRYFKRMTGMNFTDYVHRYKIGIAEQLLRNTDETVELVAAKLGYYERSYFSKLFKKYTGMTPTELRRSSSLR